MSGILELETLLNGMEPTLQQGDFVFCSVIQSYQYTQHKPVCVFVEPEGLTLILPVEQAIAAGLEFSGTFKQITLMVHSSLEAIGLTAAVANKLAEHNISANVVAAFYHDHVFVQSDKAEQALLALKEFNS